MLRFDKKTTCILKGIALVLMLVHHLFGFPEWITGGRVVYSIPVQTQSVAFFCGKFGGICVGIFMFITGYGLFFSYKKGNTFKHSLKKIAVFLVEFWILLFTFFLPVELLCGRRDFTRILYEMFGLEVSIVNFAWYVRFYILAMLTMPLLKKLLDKNLFLEIVPLLFYGAVCLFLREVAKTVDLGTYFYPVAEEYFRYMPIVMLGYIFARHNIFVKLDELLGKIKMNNIVVSILLIAAVFVLRVKVFPKHEYIPTNDFIYTPITIYAFVKLINFNKIKMLDSVFEFIGKNSMNLWFMQSVFFGDTAVLQPIAYFPRVSVLILAWTVLCLSPFSFVYNKLFKLIQNNLLKGMV